MDNVIDLSQFRKKDMTNIEASGEPLTYEEFCRMPELKNIIKGMADFFTPREQEELETAATAGTLPKEGDIHLIRHYIRYCNESLLPGINKNRTDAGFPLLEGRVLENAIDGGRWMRAQGGTSSTWMCEVQNKIYAAADRPKPGKWGHQRKGYIRERVNTLLDTVSDLLRKGQDVPSLYLHPPAYFTYRDADRSPYGFAYCVRLEVPAVVAGMTLDSLYGRIEDIANLAWPLKYRSEELLANRQHMQETVKQVLEGISHL